MGVPSMLDREVWQLQAGCRGPLSRYFFPPTVSERRDEREDRERQAKAICATCAVQASCLDYALEIREPHGIWGGLTEHERQVMLKREAG